MLVLFAPREHDDWIRDLGVAAYAALGDYTQAMTGWLSQAGIQRLVAIEDGRPVGFVLLGFTAADDLPPGDLIADLVAIAVESAWRQRGVGHELLARTIDTARAAAASAPVRRLRLTVAEDNLPARKLFAAHGFAVQDAEHGRYDHGQRALRLELDLTRS